MLNRILYWFVTLPVFAKSGCLGIVGLLFACSCLTAVSFPAARARSLEQASQTAVALRSQSTQQAIALVETSSAQSEATVQAHANATADSLAATKEASDTAIAAATATAQVASANATATVVAMQQATEAALAAAATEQAAAAATATVAAMPTPTPIPPIAYTEIGRWEKDDRLWISILIQPGLSSADVLRLARQLHASDPTARYHIFDDDSQFAKFKNWDVNDGAYPEAWINAHSIAMINQMFTDGKMEWQLIQEQDPYESISVELTTSIWGGMRGDGSITREEATGWAALFMQQTESYACCTTAVQVTDGRKPNITIAIKGELAAKSEEAYQKIAAAAFIRFQSELGECPATVMFVDSTGSPIGDSYVPTRCG